MRGTARTRLLWLGKVILSGCIAFAVLSVLCILYYNTPPRYKGEDTVTDYAWRPYTFHCTMREGLLARGRTNNEGYSNAFDYTEGMPVDVLMMGSSHMEAFQVGEDESCSVLLSDMLDGATVYNLGLSNYTLATCADDLPRVVERYRPSRYIVIEVRSLNVSQWSMKRLLDGKAVNMDSRTSGLEGVLQYDPYLRLLYKQLQGYRQGEDEQGQVQAVSTDFELLGRLFAKMADTAAISGAKIIVVYHPGVIMNRDGSITMDTDEASDAAFGKACRDNGVYFLDMRERFLAEYEENHILPYGFANTSVGSGHMNRDGHRMVAEELYALIKEVEP